MVLHRALQGPLKGPWDFQDSARQFLPFLKNTFSKPSEYHGRVYGHCWSSPRIREPSWTFIDPEMDPKVDPARLILGDPCRLKVLQGPSKVQSDPFFIDLKTTDKLKNTAWFEGYPTSAIIILICCGPFAPPPPL